jgi:hypothetical protein
MGWASKVEFPAGPNNFSHIHSIQTDSGAHLASYTMSTVGLSSVVKRPGCETGHSPPSSAEVENPSAVPPLPQTFSWRYASSIIHRDNFTFYVYQV